MRLAAALSLTLSLGIGLVLLQARRTLANPLQPFETVMPGQVFNLPGWNCFPQYMAGEYAYCSRQTGNYIAISERDGRIRTLFISLPVRQLPSLLDSLGRPPRFYHNHSTRYYEYEHVRVFVYGRFGRMGTTAYVSIR